MTPKEIKKVNDLAGTSGDLEKAALAFLGLDEKTGSEAAVCGIVDEVEQTNKAARDLAGKKTVTRSAKGKTADGDN